MHEWVCIRRERRGICVNILQRTLLSHPPKSNCKNDTLRPGFTPSSTPHLLRLQGKDDFSFCQGWTFPACDLKIMLCSFLPLNSPKAINHSLKWDVVGSSIGDSQGRGRIQFRYLTGLLGQLKQDAAFGHASITVLHREDAQEPNLLTQQDCRVSLLLGNLPCDKGGQQLKKVKKTKHGGLCPSPVKVWTRG